MTTTAQAHTDAGRRHDFVLLFDVQDGNPNGDPDAGNLPRMDPETAQGLVTDVCLKRKVRDYVNEVMECEETYKIYVQSGEALNDKHDRAYTALNIKSTGTRQKAGDVDRTRDWMCQNFYDIRTFGAVMTTGRNCGQVRGPIQLTFARSIDPIFPMDISITRLAVTKPEDMEVAVSEEGEGMGGKQNTMGRKATVPYALYLGYGFFNPSFARRTGMTDGDLQVFWNALVNMWDMDRSASRGLMACRGLYVFSHESRMGNSPAHRLLERVSVSRKDGVEAPRKFGDYTVALDESGLPDNISLTRLEG